MLYLKFNFDQTFFAYSPSLYLQIIWNLLLPPAPHTQPVHQIQTETGLAAIVIWPKCDKVYFSCLFFFKKYTLSQEGYECYVDI